MCTCAIAVGLIEWTGISFGPAITLMQPMIMAAMWEASRASLPGPNLSSLNSKAQPTLRVTSSSKSMATLHGPSTTLGLTTEDRLALELLLSISWQTFAMSIAWRDV